MSNAIKYKGELLAEDSGIHSPGGTLYQYKELRADALEADSLELTVVSESGTIRNFSVNDPIEYYRDGRRRGTYYLRSVTRVGPKLYTLSALSAVGRLMEQPHAGGVYTGQLAETVIREICGDIPVIVETAYRPIQIYNWLPYADGESRSARDNLAEVLFVLGAYLSTDEDGVLRVEKLWDGLCSAIPAGRVDSRSASEKTDQPVSAVTVTSHQYIPGTDETTLFEGTAEQGTKIIFDEPMHSLSADGLTILESGANYAVLAAGTGTLTGKTYIHNMRELTSTVTPGAAENVVAISDAKLVSLVNAADVALRMAEYYKHRTTLTVDVNPRGERAGHVVMIRHPWDGHLVPACIVSRETKVSGLLKSRTTALVDYTPPQPDASLYYNTNELLTGSGQWTAAEDGEIHLVLISAGSGGYAGKAGEQGKSGRAASWTRDIPGYVVSQNSGYLYNTPAKGGEGGQGGDGGNIYEVTITVHAGDVFAYACGAGGIGALYSADEVLAGAIGTETTFGAHSSASGSRSQLGYTDPVSGVTYAAQGLLGIAGAPGGGATDTSKYPYPPSAGSDYYRPGLGLTAPSDSSVTDEDGNVWVGGSYVMSPDADGTVIIRGDSATVTIDRNVWYADAVAASSALGGAAGGAPGGDGNAANIPQVTASGQTLTTYTQANTGGTGATPVLIPHTPAPYGQGGRGGYGGGGGGAAGAAFSSKPKESAASTSYNNVNADGGPGGLGGQGGPGAPGCILLYYHVSKAVKSGWARDKNSKWRIDRLGRRCIV